MPVLLVTEIEGQTQAGYESVLVKVGDAVRQSHGFVLHASHPTEQGWRVVEIWQSKEAATLFFSAYVAPNLPKGIRPKISFHQLHNLVRPCAWPRY